MPSAEPLQVPDYVTLETRVPKWKRALTPHLVFLENGVGNDLVCFMEKDFRTYVINRPEWTREMFLTHSQKFKRGKNPPGSFFNNTSLDTEGEFHRALRAVVSNALHGPALELISDVAKREAAAFVSAYAGKTETDLLIAMEKLGFEILAQSLLGIDDKTTTRALYAAFLEAIDFFRLPVSVGGKLQRWAYRKWFARPGESEKAIATFHNAIDAILRGNARNERSVASRLMQPGTGDFWKMSVERVTNEIASHFLSGFDSLSTWMTWLLVELKRNPTWEKNLLEDVDLGSDSILEQALEETLRLYPPAWAISRIVAEDHVFGNVTVVKGSALYFCPLVSGRDPRYFVEPKKFNPNRWSFDTKHIHLPFAAGTHGCTGEAFTRIAIRELAHGLLAKSRIDFSVDDISMACGSPAWAITPSRPIYAKITAR